MNLSFVRFEQELLVNRILDKDFNLNLKIVVGSYPNGVLNRGNILPEKLRKK